ncbi:MAG TPA: hypothetical protein VMC09_04055 [Anaerolineales bacterium]|nr:hypothetical protein [Anaerolineales bacterium]
MKFLRLLPIFIAPLILMGGGWALGQMHQSGEDIAGIFLFITGLGGLVLAFVLRRLYRKQSWHKRWYASLLFGLAGCGISFGLVVLFARLHG